MQKNIRIGKPEPINALFDVADHKNIFFVIADRAENGVLHGIGVLILIHHNFRKMHLTRKLCRGIVLIHEQLHRKVLQIVKVHDTAPQFFRLIGVHKQLYCIAQRTNRRRHHVHILAHLLFGHAQDFIRHLFDHVFPDIAAVLELLKKVFVLISSNRGNAFEAAAKLCAQLDGGIPCAVTHQRQQIFRLLLVVRKDRLILVLYDIRAVHLIQRIRQCGNAVLYAAVRLL